MSTEASPRPWKLRDEGTVFVNIQAAPDEGERYGGAVTIASGGFAKPRGVGAANAALIVRAVNAHEALIDAIKAARIHLVTLGGDRVHADQKIYGDVIHDEVLSVIDDALAKAGETP